MSLRDLPPALAFVECQHERHAIVWRAGELELPFHADPDADRALTALGGAPCRCVEVLDVWERHRADPRVLVVGPRGGEFAEGRRDSARPGPLELADVVRLGAALPRRLVATVVDALADDDEDPKLGPALYAALYGRLLVALRRWLGELPELEVELIAPSEPPALERLVKPGAPATSTGLRARLPVRWLVEVWGAELECVGANLILAAHPEPDGLRTLEGIDPLLAPTRLRLGVVAACATRSGVAPSPHGLR